MQNNIRAAQKTGNAADAVHEKITAMQDSSDNKATNPGQVSTDEMRRLHSAMDQQADIRKYRLRAASQERDIDKLWKFITAAAEASFVGDMDLKRKETANIKGRSNVAIHLSRPSHSQPSDTACHR